MTDMVDYEEFLPEVRGEVETCPEVVALNEIRNTVIDFCQKTTIWRMDLDSITVLVDTPDYEVEIDQFIKTAGINWGYLIDSNTDEVPLTITSEDTLDNGGVRSVQMWRTRTGTPSKIYLQDPRTVRLVNIPTESYSLYLGVWVKPSRASFEVPEFIYEKYLEAIAAGAKARILNMKTRPWYDPSAAALEAEEYKNRRSSALIDATKSHTRMSKSVAMRPIA